MAVQSRTSMHTTFKEIKIHTAKCDECNKHNSSTIYRCVDCSLQCCTPCWDKKGGDGTHLIKSGVITTQKPIILKAEDVDKSKVGKKKKKAARRRKKVGTTTVEAPKGTTVDDDDEEEHDTEDGTPEYKPPDQKSRQASDKSARTSKYADVDDDETDYDYLPAYAPSLPKRTTTAGDKATRYTQKGKEDSNGNDHTDVPSNVAFAENETTPKRRYAVISKKRTSDSNVGQYAWAFKHAAAEGRKRVRISSTSNSVVNSSSPAEAEPKRDNSETVEYANYLLEFARSSFPESSSPPTHKDDKHETNTSPDGAVCSENAHSSSPKPHRLSFADMYHNSQTERQGPKYRESALVNAGLTAQEYSRAQRQSKAVRAQAENPDRPSIMDQPTSASATLLSIQKHSTAVDRMGGPESHRNANECSSSLPQFEIPQSKKAREQIIDKAVQITLTRSASGMAETGEMDLKASNNFRLCKPNASTEDRSTTDEEEPLSEEEIGSPSAIKNIASKRTQPIHSNNKQEEFDIATGSDAQSTVPFSRAANAEKAHEKQTQDDMNFKAMHSQSRGKSSDTYHGTPMRKGIAYAKKPAPYLP